MVEPALPRRSAFEQVERDFRWRIPSDCNIALQASAVIAEAQAVERIAAIRDRIPRLRLLACVGGDRTARAEHASVAHASVGGETPARAEAEGRGEGKAESAGGAGGEGGGGGKAGSVSGAGGR